MVPPAAGGAMLCCQLIVTGKLQHCHVTAPSNRTLFVLRCLRGLLPLGQKPFFVKVTRKMSVLQPVCSCTPFHNSRPEVPCLCRGVVPFMLSRLLCRRTVCNYRQWEPTSEARPSKNGGRVVAEEETTPANFASLCLLVS